MLKISLPPAIASFFQPAPLPLSPLRWWLAPLGFGGVIALMVALSLLGLSSGFGQNLLFLCYVILASLMPLLCMRPVLRWHLGLDTSTPGFWRRFIGYTLLGLAMMLAVSHIFISLSPQVRESTALVVREFGFGQNAATDIWLVITITIGAPLGEEAAYRVLFFRSLYDGLRNLGSSKLAPWLSPGLSLFVALMTSGLVFASIHGSPGQDVQFIPLLLHGIIFAWIYERSGSIFVPILVHSLNNALSLYDALGVGITTFGSGSGVVIAAPARLLIIVAPLITFALVLLWRQCVPRGKQGNVLLSNGR